MKTYKERVEKSYEKAAAIKAKRKRLGIIAGAASVCMCLAVIVSSVLFVPYRVYPFSVANAPDISKYYGSEYYNIIKSVNELTYGDSEIYYTTTNYDKWFNSSLPPTSDGDLAGSTPDVSAPPTNYEEVTANQVAGVIEGDIFKRTSENIFYLSWGVDSLELRIYPIDIENSQVVSTCRVHNDGYPHYSLSGEMFLSTDGNTITVFSNAYTRLGGSRIIRYTEITQLDVSDVNDIKVTGKLFVSGNYVSARLVGGKFLLITDFNVSRYPDFDDQRQFLPQTGEEGEMESLSPDNIICPAEPTSASYTIVCTIDENFKIDGKYAFMSYTETVYVSEKNIFTARNYTDTVEGSKSKKDLCNYTEISCISHSDGKLEYVGSANVPGSVLNQYSMDERDNVLRVATTERLYTIRKYHGYYSYEYQSEVTEKRNASVYCVDLKNFTIIGSLKRFAPDGEVVRAARFDGDKAYVCTSFENTDPVFAIDLSDISNITCKDTGTIPGYSMSLTRFYDDTLLGIGYDGDNNLKVEIYRENDCKVESVAVYGRDDALLTSFSSDFKAYFIDAEDGYIGLAINEYKYSDSFAHSLWETSYILLKFDGESLTLAIEEKFDYSDCGLYRATEIDGNLYILNGTDYRVIAING